jgi:hypothetical protein
LAGLLLSLHAMLSSRLATASLVAAMATSGCGVTSLALYATGANPGETLGTSERPRNLETAPASIAVVRWSGLSLSCGRVTDIRVRRESVGWTPIVKVLMGMFAAFEAIPGSLALGEDRPRDRVLGGLLLGDALLTIGLIAFMPRRYAAEEWDRFGLAYHCNPQDGFAIGSRIAPVGKDGLSVEDRDALASELAAGGNLAFAVDGHLLAIPLSAAERCTALRALGSPAACESEAPADVVIPLTRAPAVVTMPVVPPAPVATAPDTANGGPP